ncbi:MAG TPA: Calx-beta domain-containing protein [Candidatus Limnocylindria bacterium]|nr:Calx-beta domain-containing protein [Candidatus Limnocylindria bacterium]
MKNSSKLLLAVLGSAVLGTGSARAQILYSDTFDTDTSAAWLVFNGALTGPPDFTAQFFFDYSIHGIPPAPNSTGGTTRGLKLTVNKDDTAAEAAVSVYPASQSFSGNYALKFDLWMGYNGPAFGGSGSTEFATFGLNHTVSEVNWTLGPGSDGVWFTVCGEGGAARDFRAYVGEPGVTPIELQGVDAGFLDRDGDGIREVETEPDAGSVLDYIFSTPPFETRGAPGKRWVQVEVRQNAGLVTWLMNGFVIAEHSNLNNFTAGDIMLGNMDIFSSIADPKAENFVIYDNVRVENLPATPLPVVSITATDDAAAESGGDTGSFTVTRTGDTSAALTVNFLITGTASNGVDYIALPTSVTLATDVSSTNFALTPIDDPIGEGIESITVSILGTPLSFEVRENIAATVQLADDADKPLATVATTRPAAYESIPDRKGQFTVRLSNPNSTDTTVLYALAGTATNGVDYVTLPGSVILPAAITNALLDVVAINNGLLDTNRTVIITLLSNALYTVGAPSNATVTIRNDDLPLATTVFTDNFDTDSSPNWLINKADANTSASFGYNYSIDGVPPAPTSTNTTLGLKLFTSAGLFTGLSVSPAGQSFTGDYRVRFDMWVNYNGPLNGGGAGSTEALTFGVGTTGISTQWPAATIDSVMFAVTGDGGSATDYRAYVPDVLLGVASGAYAAGTQSTARNNSDPYYAEFGRETAPAAQISSHSAQAGVSLVGCAGMAWHDIVVIKQGTNVTWIMDGTRIATVNTTTFTLSSNIFLGYFDTANGLPDNPAMCFALVDNLRVETFVTVTRPTLGSIRYNAGAIEFDFTGQAADAASAFTLVGSGIVTGPYNPVTGASIAALGGGQFRASAPAPASAQFYQIRR